MTEAVETKPNWRIARDRIIKEHRPNQSADTRTAGSKYMDQYAMVPVSHLSQEEMTTLGLEWKAYELMLLESRKRYIQETMTADFSGFVADLHNDGTKNVVAADFGCGNGGMSKFFIDTAENLGVPSKFYLIDRSPAALHHGLLRFEQDGFARVGTSEMNGSCITQRRGREDQTIEFMQRDATDTGLENNSVDIVTNVNVFHHLTADEGLKLANEIHRVLKPGGYFIIEDTAKLPDNLLGKVILPKIIDKAVSVATISRLAKEAGIEMTDGLITGAELFIHDAKQAFVQSMSLGQFEELLKESKLGPSLTEVRSIKSPKFPWKHLFPAMNYALGKKIN